MASKRKARQAAQAAAAPIFLIGESKAGAGNVQPSALEQIRDDIVKHRLLAGQLRGRLTDLCAHLFGSEICLPPMSSQDPAPVGIVPLIFAESADLAATLRDLSGLVEQLESL